MKKILWYHIIASSYMLTPWSNNREKPWTFDFVSWYHDTHVLVRQLCVVKGSKVQKLVHCAFVCAVNHLILPGVEHGNGRGMELVLGSYRGNALRSKDAAAWMTCGTSTRWVKCPTDGRRVDLLQLIFPMSWPKNEPLKAQESSVHCACSRFGAV